MKKTFITLATLALLSGSAFAGKEHCVTRNVIANYVNGSGLSTVCSATDSKFVETKLKCETRK